MEPTEQESTPEIICKESGPYIVKNVNRMVGTSGETWTPTPTMALCRCGKSSNKPFCDGTHVKAGFTGENDTQLRTEDRKDTYIGKDITIHDNRGLCAHAGICTENLASVFRMGTEPWIDPDQASVEQIKKVIDKCPSGALSFSIDGVQQQGQNLEPTIKVLPDGPYEIIGDLEISDVTPLLGASKNTRTLCRCGHSNNKPFCDGSHWSAGFKDA
jgi:CDGSH-type Zn-finger protein